MLDRVRTSLHRLITTPVGDGFLPVRLPKDLARRVNMTLGDPLCSADELTRRRNATERLAKLKAGGTSQSAGSELPRVAAPVMIYFEKDRNVRLLGRIRETLESRNIAFTELDVSGDGPAKAYAMREAKCKEDDLPIVFVATTVIGGFNDLVEWDVSGKLETAVYGAKVKKILSVSLASYKLRFHDQHVRAVPARDGEGCVFTGPGIDLRGEEARAIIALSTPFHGWLEAREPGSLARALSVEVRTGRVLITLESLRVVRIDAPESKPLLDDASPLQIALGAACAAKLRRRATGE